MAAAWALARFAPGLCVDGDLAAVHVRARANPQDRGFAIVDILRLANGKIVLDRPRGTLTAEDVHRLYAMHTEEAS